MSFGLRSVFTAPNTTLRQQAGSANLAAPISVKLLAGHVAIAARYIALGGFRGALGVSTTGITESTDGLSFVQSFRGGDLKFTNDGDVQLDRGVALKIDFAGIHCFGNPGLGKNDTVYGIISWYIPEQAKTTTVKVPNDNSDDAFENFEQGEDRTEGATELLGLQPVTPPQPVILSANVVRCPNFGGCNSEETKANVASAFSTVGQTYGYAVGGPVGAEVLSKIGDGIGKTLAGVFFGDNPMNPASKPLSLEAIRALPPMYSLSQGPINYNFETDIISDGDASYKMYFNLHLYSVIP